MRVEHFQNLFNIGANGARQASPMDRLASVLKEKPEGQSPLETARQALVKAKTRLEEQRDERVEQAMAGYKALRSRQTSYENELSARQTQLESFQTLNSRYDALSRELSCARAEYEAGAATEALPDIRLSQRVTSLEQELAGTDRDISALVERANRYANGQRQYAAYLEKTGQDGYAAFEYREQGEYTRENFASETAGMIARMETGAGQWRERVSSYCAQYGLTASDFESYLQERRELGDAYFAARQRLSELLYAAGAALTDGDKLEKTEQSAAPVRGSFDTVELSDSARDHVQRAQPPAAAVDEAETNDM